MRARGAVVAGTAAAVLMLWACQDYIVGATGPAERAARAIQLDSAAFGLNEGDTLRLAATVLDQTGKPFTDLPVGVTLTWSSSDSAVAVVSSTGLVTAIGPGNASVAATVATDVGSFSASAAGTVFQIPTRIVAAAGGGQRVPAGDSLPGGIQAKVLDAAGRGIPGIAVRFVTRGGGTVSPTSATTDSLGTARVAFTADTTPGTDSVMASTVRLPDSVAVFTEQVVAGPPARLTKVGGDGQPGARGRPLASPLVVGLVDRFGNAIAGATVGWSVTAGGGSVQPSVGTTGSTGRTQTTWTLGPAVGGDTVVAAVQGDDSVRAVFSATALASGPMTMTVAAGDAQVDTIDATLALQYEVQVTDSAGAGVAGVGVTWSVQAGGGSITPGTGVTDANGLAVATRKLGEVLGTGAQTAEACITGTADCASFTATATPGRAAAVAAQQGDLQTAPAGSVLSVAPSVVVHDRIGDPVANVLVTFAVAGGGGSVTGAAQRTDSSGVATVGSWTLGASAGTNTLTATASGSGIAGNPVTFTATATTITRRFEWLGTAADSTNWSDPANWSSGNVPTATDTVVIDVITKGVPVLTRNAVAAALEASAGSLTLNGHTLTVGGDVTVSGTGIVVMNSAPDSLLVGGTATFGGGDETGRLTAGTMIVDGNFVQPPAPSANAFAASGTLTTILTGLRGDTLSFNYGNNSHFANLELGVSGGSPTGFQIRGRTPVTGTLTVEDNAAVSGNDTLVVGGDVSLVGGSPGAQLSTPGLVVHGTLSGAPVSYDVAVTNFAGTGQRIPGFVGRTLMVSGAGALTPAAPLNLSGNLLVRPGGSLTLAAPLNVQGADTVTGSLTLGGQTLTVGGDLTVGGSGTVTMTDAADSLVVAGTARFGGGDETGKLSAGVLTVGGDFVQPGAQSALAFNTSGTFTTVLTGVQAQTANMYYAGGNNSHFQNLELAGTSGMTFTGRIPVLGSLTVSGARTVTANDSVVVAGDVTSAAGSEMDFPGLDVGGALTVNGNYGVVAVNFTGVNQVIPDDMQNRGQLYTTIIVSGTGATTATPTGSADSVLTALGSIQVVGSGSLTLGKDAVTVADAVVSGGSLTLGGHYLVATGSLRVSGTGVVVMTNPADSLVAESGVVWGGGDETGKLTAGVLVILGNFSQPGAQSATSFNTSGTFSTLFVSGSPITIGLTYAGGSASHFQNLDLTGAVGGVTLTTDLPVAGTFADSLGPILPTTISGNGHTISAAGTAVDGMILDHALFKITTPAAAGLRFDDVTFQNFATTDTELSVTGAGTGSFNNLTFLTTPTTGYYLSANNNGSGLGLTITSNLGASGATYTQLLNGATVSWR